MSREGALIAPARLEGDVAERQIRFAEEPGRLVEADLVEELERAHLEETSHPLLELVDAESGH